MRVAKFSANSQNLITLKGEDWVLKQREAGKIAAKTLSFLKRQVEEKTTLSLIELNELAEEIIIKDGGIPTFKGYKGFPAGVCISVNNELVHGIPGKYKLQEGDVISFDLGVTIEGSIADTAITCIYGKSKYLEDELLVKTTEECLDKAIENIKVGERLGVIGHTIYRHARDKGFNVITRYGGHGLNWNVPHDAPFVTNKAEKNEGIRIQPGLTIAIEPLLSIGDPTTFVLDDDWTVKTRGRLNAHFEHSIYVHEDSIEVMTKR